MSVDPSIKLLQERAWAYLEQHLDKVYTYHNAAHAMEVCAAVEEFAPECNFTIFDLDALRLAAIFHDFGYLEASDNNESLALPYLNEFASACGIDRKLIEHAGTLIMETSFPYCPRSAAGKLLCDADIEYIGRSVFFRQAELFRLELTLQGKSFTDLEWWQYELDFLMQNDFYTPICRRNRDAGKLENTELVRQRIKAWQGS